jgi:hypothetical protein
LTPYETEEFKKKLEESEYAKSKFKDLNEMKTFLEFFLNMNKNAHVSVNVCLKGIGAVEASVSGEGLGELINFLAKAGLHRQITRNIETLNEL